MKKLLHLLLATGMVIYTHSTFSQPDGLTLSFTGDNHGQYVALDSVLIKNLTQGYELMVYDSTFFITGISEPVPSGRSNFTIHQRGPNPYTFRTNFDVMIPTEHPVCLGVYNVLGQLIYESSFGLQAGTHRFELSGGSDQLSFFTVSYQGITKSHKLIHEGTNSNVLQVRYEGLVSTTMNYKSDIIVSNLSWSPGDKLLLAGYSYLGESGIVDTPDGDTLYTIQFATNQPCLGLDSLYYENQWYHTIQIFGQCWMKENLNVGTMITSGQTPSNNNIIEKYCMINSSNFCEIAGGLYTWNEMMNYSQETGGQGICPDGWHIPDDLEWQILEGATDSEFLIGSSEWENTAWRGSDAGGNLKQSGTSFWTPPNSGATDAFSFNAVPAGYYVQGGFWGYEYKNYLWSSTFPGQYYRNLDWDQVKIKRNTGDNAVAISVRCIKD
ncbi:MAG: fibrobacter succinogenes major paralogous domain-containing protein [Bacteroidetes bacterium]|nr:fibrobacter succinogenes major paralogous domain-containing protein [Bacteroidota bacterium]